MLLSRRNARAFSLVELLIALAIVGILTTLAMPTYNAYQQRSVQTEAMVTLQLLAALQERLRLTQGRYQPVATLLALRQLPSTVADHYRLAVALEAQGAGFSMTMTPSQVDSGYSLLSIDHVGRRTPMDAWH
tara:strand:- start:86 stop:481 length:396 start_codon:yes stop_codon:yes gene_type:complete